MGEDKVMGNIDGIPFVAVGNDELGEMIGKTCKCPKCGKKHLVKYGTDKATGKTTKMLGYVNCGKESYLVAINGRELKEQ